MHPQNTIPIIKRELIRSFAALDRSFDDKREFLHFRHGHWNALQILQHVSIANNNLLTVIRNAAANAIELAKQNELCDEWFENYNLYSFDASDFDNYRSGIKTESPVFLSLHQIRSTLRSQLSECFDYVDLLKNGEGILYKHNELITGAGELDVYHLVYFLACYGRSNAAVIERLQTEYENPMELQ